MKPLRMLDFFTRIHVNDAKNDNDNNECRTHMMPNHFFRPIADHIDDKTQRDTETNNSQRLTKRFFVKSSFFFI